MASEPLREDTSILSRKVEEDGELSSAAEGEEDGAAEDVSQSEEEEATQK